MPIPVKPGFLPEIGMGRSKIIHRGYKACGGNESSRIKAI